jgi:hypothetical protein
VAATVYTRERAVAARRLNTSIGPAKSRISTPS